MSFFVSNSLKDIITEQDLLADSPIKIIEERESITIKLSSENQLSFEVELLEMNFGKDLDELTVSTSKACLENIFVCNTKKVDCSILLNNSQAYQIKGTLILGKLEVNKKDNYVMCKIDIIKEVSKNV